MATVLSRGDWLPLICPLTRPDGSTFVIPEGTVVRARLLNVASGVGPEITCNSTDDGADWSISKVAAIFYPAHTNNLEAGETMLEVEVDAALPTTFYNSESITVRLDCILPL